jgi:UDP-N-acetylmuramoylalanine--D-glutamate ligase
MGGAEDHHPVSGDGDHLRPLQSHDLEAEVTMGFEVTGRHVVVVGGGRSGCAAADLLVSRGARVTLTDSREALDDALRALATRGVAVELGPHRPDLLRRADLIVISPGVPPTQPAIAAAREAGVPVMGEIELASRLLAGRIVAVTGTKGKSTTTTLTSRMLQQAGMVATAGGNLGTALSTQVADSRADTVHVVEVSSFQLEMTDTFHPWIAVLLNLSADHLDRHRSFESYAAAKARIFANQTEADWAVINADDAACLELASHSRARRFDFGLEAAPRTGVSVDQQHIVERRDGAARPLIPLASVRLPGRHLLTDVLAATAVGCLAGVPPDAMRAAVEGFAGLEHALETVAEIGGVRFVNDSKATNVLAARRAIDSFDGGVVVIMGGRYKGGDLAELRESVRQRVAAVVAIGEAQPRIESALAPITSVRRAATMNEAVSAAFDAAAPGGVVLLAPACSSFDMFADYAARGRAFKDAVRRLEHERDRRSDLEAGV